MSEGAENVVVVAVRAEREISKAALAWALTHVVRPGDLVTLLAVLTDHDVKPSWRRRLLWGFPRFSGDCSSRRRERSQISASCSQMALQIDGQNEMNVRIKVVGSEMGGAASSSSASGGVVAAESKRVGAYWVVLDKQLKQEEKQCMQQLQCNIVVMKGSSAKVLRLNLGGPNNKEKACPPFFPSSSSCSPSCTEKFPDNRRMISCSTRKVSHLLRENRSSSNLASASSCTREPFSLVFAGGRNPLYEGSNSTAKLSSKEGAAAASVHAPGTNSDSDGSEEISPFSPDIAGLDFRHIHGAQGALSSFHPEPCSYPPPPWSSPSSAPPHNHGVYWIPHNHISEEEEEEEAVPFVQRYKLNHNHRHPLPPTSRTLLDKFSESDHESVLRKLRQLNPNYLPAGAAESYGTYSSGVREAVSLFGSSPSIPPPLCTLCRHKAPVFGKPPRQFTYRELEEATGGFSNGSFVAQGGLGTVHRGVLGDGQVVAVKQLKRVAASSLDDFLTNIEVLSRAQHRNVVMLVGFCIEGERRVLVYEYICNGSLALHLHGGRKPGLAWHARVKIALGVARGLRYLHEDCRVGFVVHKDLRPNNILLTHDFEPLVGDFSLTEWQQSEAQVAETFGYLAPEYIEQGIVSEKVDVYAFGVILLELITGRRALDTTHPKGQQFLVEWARPLLSLASEGHTISVQKFLDPCFDRSQAHFFSHQLRAMACAASLCLHRDPQGRPGMSKVLRVLEGNASLDPCLDINVSGSRSGRISHAIQHQETKISGSVSLRFPHDAVDNAISANEEITPIQLNYEGGYQEISRLW